MRIALAIVAAMTTAVAVGEAVRSSGGAAASNQVAPRIAALAWPASIKPHIDTFESSSAAALNQLRSAASNPFGYDASQVNAAIATFNTAANVVRHDLGLPPD